MGIDQYENNKKIFLKLQNEFYQNERKGHKNVRFI